MVVALSVVVASGTALAASISGDATANVITGTADADSLFGYAGDDTISGGSAADRIFGGDDNDKLFGTDESQTGISDGNRASTDGNDRVEGEKGDDTVVGASGADTLRGGPGSDTIVEGPANDQAPDVIEADPTYFSGGPPPESANWNDRINVFSLPAAKDTVNCGPGTDTVQVDPLDVVSANCENVENLNPADMADPAAGGPDPETGEVPPLVVSSDEVVGSEEPAPGDDVPPSDDTASEQSITPMTCYPPGYWRGYVFCGKKYVPLNARLGVYMNYTKPDAWIKFLGQRWGYQVGRTPWLYDNYDEWGYMYENLRFGNGTTIYVYANNQTGRWPSVYFNGGLKTYR